jgi:hypothetical protein
MAFQAVPDVIEASTHFIAGGIPMVNTYYAERSGGYIQSDLDQLANTIDIVIFDEFLPLLSVNVEYLRTQCRGLASATDLYAEDSAGTGFGAVIGDMLAPHTTLAIKKTSAFTGRSARGRIYWPGITASQGNGGQNVFVSGAFAAAAVAAVDEIRQGIIGLGMVPVIVSRFTGGAPRTVGVTFEWIATSVTNTAVDSQRRRSGN